MHTDQGHICDLVVYGKCTKRWFLSLQKQLRAIVVNVSASYEITNLLPIINMVNVSLYLAQSNTFLLASSVYPVSFLTRSINFTL